MLRNFRGSTGARAVIAVLMLLFVVACAGSDSGIKRERDEARAAAEAAEAARLAAEAAAAEQVRMAAEAAAAAEAARLAAEAAAAEQARLAAEAAAAAAAAEEARMAAEAAAEEERARLAAEAAAAEAAAEAARLAAEAAAAEEARLARIDEAMQAIAGATTAAGAQAAKDAVNDVATALEAIALQDAVDARIEALATMARAEAQRMALMTAAGAIDTSDLMDAAAVAAANTAIAALEAAIAAAVDVDDTSMYQGIVDAAKNAVAAAQSTLDHAAQTAALTSAVEALQAIDLTALSTQAKIDAANAAIAAVHDALAKATELSAAEKAMATTVLAIADRNVMAAQGTFDTAAQTAALEEATDALAALNLDNLMTQEQIDAAVAAITKVRLALAAATNLDDADKLDATVDVTVAQRKVDRAETTLTENVGNQRTALNDAVAALHAIDIDDLDTQEKIGAAQAALDVLKAALDAATHLSDAEKADAQRLWEGDTEIVRTARTGMDRDDRMMAQRTAITNAVTAARTAVGMVDDDATDAQVKAADDAVAALNAALDGAEDLPEGDAEVAMAQGTLETLEGQLASAKTSRTAAMAAQQDAEDKDMVETAAKLHDGISVPTPTDTNLADTPTQTGTRFAGYVTTADTPTGASVGDIVVGISNNADVALSEDKKTSVPALHGWEGKRYTAEPAGDGMYEAMVYSNVGEPTEGDPFDEEYTNFVTTTGLPLVTDNANTGDFDATRVASSSFDQSAGTKRFKLGDNDRAVVISGSYHGVPGTYSCTVVTGGSCTVTKASQGFTLAGVDSDGTADPNVDWTFKPSNPDTKVTSTADPIYASYGWWIHKSEDGSDFTASAFVADKGEVPDAAALDALQGTATYMGGAVGKYALSSSTGGTNDAGHFIARATLEADFSDNSITGTIDNFMGADGAARDWSVELKEAAIDPTGGITRTADNDTVWTRDGDAADASGEWSGSLQDNGDDGVPKVGTGTFYTEYGRDGGMVGAFGVNKQ